MKAATKDLVRLDGSYLEPIECNYIIAIMRVGFWLKTKAVDGLRAEVRMRECPIGLLNLCPFGTRGFESHPRRYLSIFAVLIHIIGYWFATHTALRVW